MVFVGSENFYITLHSIAGQRTQSKLNIHGCDVMALTDFINSFIKFPLLWLVVGNDNDSVCGSESMHNVRQM